MPGTTPTASFDEKHPRGQPDNPGQFKSRQLPPPPAASPRRPLRPPRGPRRVPEGGRRPLRLSDASLKAKRTSCTDDQIAMARAFLSERCHQRDDRNARTLTVQTSIQEERGDHVPTSAVLIAALELGIDVGCGCHDPLGHGGEFGWQRDCGCRCGMPSCHTPDVIIAVEVPLSDDAFRGVSEDVWQRVLR